MKNKNNHNPPAYSGDIRRSDGRRPYNYFLRPTEEWWISQLSQFEHIGERYYFQCVHLSGGIFATDGCVYGIERGLDGYGLKIVFETREQAIRASAARMIRTMRWYRDNPEKCHTNVSASTYLDIAKWTIEKVKKICSSPYVKNKKSTGSQIEKKPEQLLLGI